MAAEAAECAGLQGKFWEMHTLIFLNQDAWSGNENALRTLVGYGNQLGLDQTAFQRCLNDHETLPQIQADYDYGTRIGLRSTPTFLIAGAPGSNQFQALEGAQPYSAFRQIIDRFLGVVPTTPATTPE